MTEQLTSVIGSLGFPIAVCVYLLISRERTTKELIKAINDLTLLIKTKLK